VRRTWYRRRAAALEARAAQLRAGGQYSASVPVTRQCVEVRRRLAAIDPGAARDLASSLDRLQLWLSTADDDHERAYDAGREAVAVWRTVDERDHLHDWRSLASALAFTAQTATFLGRYDEAVRLGEEALARYRHGERDYEGGNPGIAMALDILAVAYRNTGREAAAREAEQESTARWPREED
jgi:tetratricopeptide (TPR) repeat protein